MIVYKLIDVRIIYILILHLQKPGVHISTLVVSNPDCTYQIIGVSKVVAIAGMLQSDINTWKDCISTCATPGCQSVDFNTVTNKCYHFSAPYDTGLGTDNDVLHFVQKCVKSM